MVILHFCLLLNKFSQCIKLPRWRVYFLILLIWDKWTYFNEFHKHFIIDGYSYSQQLYEHHFICKNCYALYSFPKITLLHYAVLVSLLCSPYKESLPPCMVKLTPYTELYGAVRCVNVCVKHHTLRNLKLGVLYNEQCQYFSIHP